MVIGRNAGVEAALFDGDRELQIGRNAGVEAALFDKDRKMVIGRHADALAVLFDDGDRELVIGRHAGVGLDRELVIGRHAGAEAVLLGRELVPDRRAGVGAPLPDDVSLMHGNACVEAVAAHVASPVRDAGRAAPRRHRSARSRNCPCEAAVAEREGATR